MLGTVGAVCWRVCRRDVCNLILGRKKLEKQGRSADACRGSHEKKKKKSKREREIIQEKRNQVDFELFYGFYNVVNIYLCSYFFYIKKRLLWNATALENWKY